MPDLPPTRPVESPKHRWWGHPRKLWILGLSLLVAVGTWLSLRSQLASNHPRPPLRILVVRAAADPGCGLNDSEAQTLSSLLEDVFEGLGNASVSKAEALPESSIWPEPAPEGLVIRLHPRRIGERLALDVELASPDRIQRNQPLVWRTMTPQAPAEAFLALVRSLPLEMLDPRIERLLPRSPAAFWPMVSALDASIRSDPSPEAFAAATAASDLEPTCAGPGFVLGRLHLLRASAASGTAEDLERAKSAFSDALLVTSNYPRGLYDLTRLRSDTGSAQGTLGLLLKARAARPNSRGVLGALAYCARYAGMLDLAVRATGKANALDLNPKAPPRIQLAPFYQGDLATFERSLYLRPGSHSNDLVQFYMGRLALQRGLKEQAIARFEEGESGINGSPKVARLNRSFRLILQGHPQKARVDLDKVRQEQDSTRVPDGETTLSVAEAYLLLGDQDAAMDLAELAVRQGFHCTPWFDRNPLLAPLHGTPRWEALHQRLLEQQALVEALHPAKTWDF